MGLTSGLRNNCHTDARPAGCFDYTNRGKGTKLEFNRYLASPYTKRWGDIHPICRTITGEAPTPTPTPNCMEPCPLLVHSRRAVPQTALNPNRTIAVSIV